MILNILERKILNLGIQDQLKDKLCAPLRKKNKLQGCSKTDLLITISFKYIKLCDKLILANNLKDAEVTLDFIRQIMSQIYLFDESYAWILLKTRLIVLRISFIENKKEFNPPINKNLKRNKQKEDEIYLERVTAFCQEIYKNKHFNTLKCDYYSYLEIIYMYGIRNCFQYNRFYKCLTLINRTIDILSCQLDKLCELLCMEDKKVFRIIEAKCEILLKLYGFESSIRIKQNNQETMQIIDDVWKKYQIIMQKVPNMVNKQKIDDILKEIFLNKPLTKSQLSKEDESESQKDIFYEMINNKRTGILRQNKSDKLPIKNEVQIPISNKNMIDENKQKKSRVQFALKTQEEESSIPDNDIQSNSKLSQIPQLAAMILETNTMNPNIKNVFSKARNRFMSIQYNLADDEENKQFSKSMKKIDQKTENHSQSKNHVSEFSEGSLRNKKINKKEQKEEKKQLTKIGSMQQNYNKTIFRIAKSYSSTNLSSKVSRLEINNENRMKSSLQNLSIISKTKHKSKNKSFAQGTFLPFVHT